MNNFVQTFDNRIWFRLSNLEYHISIKRPVHKVVNTYVSRRQFIVYLVRRQMYIPTVFHETNAGKTNCQCFDADIYFCYLFFNLIRVVVVDHRLLYMYIFYTYVNVLNSEIYCKHLPTRRFIGRRMKISTSNCAPHFLFSKH